MQLQLIDFLVLFLYFAGMAGVGFWLMRGQKKQEDFFMAGRSFGKLMQTFAAFGSGTGSADPVNTARGTFLNGMSGMWSVMYWLFVTPVYWISAVWYRRMRSLTLGDWFVERYESKAIGVAYALFGCFFYMTYGAMMFTAIGKVAAPLLGETMFGMQLQYTLLPFVAVVVITYGLLGGIAAAYWTDLIQGICIIVLSVLLIPFGLKAVVDKFGSKGDGLMDAFRLMHEQLGDEAFTIIGGSTASEFPLYAIVAIVIINMIGIVLTPHFIVTGGGTAKSEWDARVGLVTGNFIKRFCTIGWVITALIVLTLYGSDADPDGGCRQGLGRGHAQASRAVKHWFGRADGRLSAGRTDEHGGLLHDRLRRAGGPKHLPSVHQARRQRSRESQACPYHRRVGCRRIGGAFVDHLRHVRQPAADVDCADALRRRVLGGNVLAARDDQRRVDHVHLLPAVFPRAAHRRAQAQPRLGQQPGVHAHESRYREYPHSRCLAAGRLAWQGECRRRADDGDQAARRRGSLLDRERQTDRRRETQGD